MVGQLQAAEAPLPEAFRGTNRDQDNATAEPTLPENFRGTNHDQDKATANKVTL